MELSLEGLWHIADLLPSLHIRLLLLVGFHSHLFVCPYKCVVVDLFFLVDLRDGFESEGTHSLVWLLLTLADEVEPDRFGGEEVTHF